jgi:o-succinylbenzoate synthase
VQLSFAPLVLPLRAPWSTARGELRERRGFTVRVEEGTGEATPPEELGFDSLAQVEPALRAARERLIPLRAPDSVEGVREVMAALPDLDSSPAARHGVELALLDRAARSRRVPLRELLAPGQARSTVTVNALVSGPSAAADALRDGFQTVKLKVGGRPVAEDVERVREVRRAIGPAARLRIDPNGSWSEPQAIRALEAMARLQLELCEQPTDPRDPDQMLRVRRAVRVPIAADESLALQAWRPGLWSGNVDAVVLKPMVLGGLLTALDVAREAAFYEVGAYVTSSIDGEVARAGCAQLAAAIPQTAWAHGLATGALLATADRTSWLSPGRGAITLPASPGTGVA